MKASTFCWGIPASFVFTVFLHAVLAQEGDITVSNITTIDDTVTQNSSTSVESEYSDELKKCIMKSRIVFFQLDEIKIFSNWSIYIPQHKRMYDPRDYYHIPETNQTIVCEPLPDFSEEFSKCQTKHVELEPYEFIMLDNGSVHVPDYGKVYDEGNYYFNRNTNNTIVCLPTRSGGHEEDLEANDIAQSIVSFIGLSISILALVLHLVAFLLVSEIRNLPGYCLASMSIALLVAYLCFVSIPAAMSNSITCPQLAVVMYYFFLSSFFWMSTIAYDVFRTLRLATKRLRLSSNKVPWKRFLVYSMYSWLVPFAIVLTSVLIDKYADIPLEYKTSFSKSNMCWFYGSKAHFIYFVLPTTAIVVVNVVLLTASGIIIHKASMKSSHDGRAVLRQRFLMFFKLATIMGLGWLFGIIAVYVKEVVLWYIFVIINTLQGLFIFLGFSLTQKVRSNLSVRFTVKKVSATLSNKSVSQVSTVSATV